MASFPSSRVDTLRSQQHLHDSVGSTHAPASGSHMAASQPNFSHIASVSGTGFGSSSQAVVGAIAPDSPRRSRSHGSTSSYRLSYHRRGIEHSHVPFR